MHNIVEIINAAFDYHLHDICTAIPCTIVSVRDAKQQRVDVKPLINRVKPDDTIVENSTILSVPVIFPATSTSSLTFKLNVGDTVLCVFSHRCIDSFKAGDGKPAAPIDMRKMHKRDAAAIVGLFPFSKATNNPSKRKWAHNTNDTVLAHNLGSGKEIEIRLTESGKIIINTDDEFQVNCKTATVNATTSTHVTTPTATIDGNLVVNGNINCSQTVTATTDVLGGGKSLLNHTHKGTPNTVCVNGSPWTGDSAPPT